MMIIEEMTIPANDLSRFVQAQDELFCDYGQALKEVQEDSVTSELLASENE